MSADGFSDFSTPLQPTALSGNGESEKYSRWLADDAAMIPRAGAAPG
jgi:hypothetical protein